MKTSHKGYMSPWSSRRETIGLAGAFLIFLLGLPIHSELLVNEMRLMAQQFMRLMLVCLGLLVPAVQSGVPRHFRPRLQIHRQQKLPVPAADTLAPMVTPSVVPNWMSMHITPVLRHREYFFTGKAMFRGQPCPQANVTVRLTDGERITTQSAMTDDDGTYVVRAAIDAGEKDPVDWTINAYSQEFRQVELSGRRIVQDGDDVDHSPVTVDNPVEFVASLSK
jgi:hypothetical protein